jgi:glycosyltransferase involved in cell wall biosynthesis
MGDEPHTTDAVALVHDYLTQRGGAERVVSALVEAFPDAPLHTSFYDPAGTYPSLRRSRIVTLPIDKVAWLRRHHRLALPLLAPAFSALRVDARVTVCSTSGWAHGARTTGRKVVYCHAPARWLYQTDAYLEGWVGWARYPLWCIAPSLRRWDRRAASSADRYLVVSTVIREQVERLYGIDAEVLPPPPGLTPAGGLMEVEGVEEGFFLCVSRLLPYKHVLEVVKSFRMVPEERLVVVGTGPLEQQIRAEAPRNVTLLGRLDDEQLRWLYNSSAGLVAASQEDFGLTPIEAASFGKPSVVLRRGGYLDTTSEGTTGVFFDRPEAPSIAEAVRDAARRRWDIDALRSHADRFSRERFVERMRQIVAEESDSTI